jgi:DNA-binding winged helix-turn-helix (wHTH) protein
MTARNSSAFLFDDIRVEPTTFRAFKAEQVISLEPKTLRLLLFLIENRGRLIEKDEILDAIWSGTHVTENALTREIGKLRKSLGDDPKAPKYIETVHTRGYRFIAELAEANGSGAAVSPEVETVEAETQAENLSEPAPVLATAPVALKVTPAGRTHLYRVIATVVAIAIGLGVISGIILWKRRSAPVPPPTPVAGNSCSRPALQNFVCW